MVMPGVPNSNNTSSYYSVLLLGEQFMNPVWSMLQLTSDFISPRTEHSQYGRYTFVSLRCPRDTEIGLCYPERFEVARKAKRDHQRGALRVVSEVDGKSETRESAPNLSVFEIRERLKQLRPKMSWRYW